MILRKNKGFTLIEVIISIAIIAIIGVLLSNLVSTTVKARNVSQERLQILAYCTSHLNEIKSVQDSLSSIVEIEELLQDKGFTKEAAVYKKTENTNIDIEISFSQHLNKSGLFEINIIGSSPNVREISISTVVKGGALN